MSITPLPALDRASPTFKTEVDDFFANKLPAFSVEANAAAIALTLNATTDASVTSNAIGVGAKTFTASTGKSFLPGMYLVIADTAAPSTNSMFGQITSYNSGTGELVIQVLSVLGSGTKAAWLISQSSIIMQPMPAGSVVHVAMSAAPSGYLKANGAIVSRATYSDLFAAIGTVFGVGDGSTTFALPDLRGEFIRGWDDARGVDASRASGSAQGDVFKSHTHVQDAHNHTQNAHNHAQDPHNHSVVYYQGSGGGGQPLSDSTAVNSLAYNTADTYATNQAATAVNQVATATNQNTGDVTETRPRNVALLACIKY